MEQVENDSVPQSTSLGDFVDLLRPLQWIKNVVVFAGPAAGLTLASPAAFGQSCVAFMAFCLTASATYAVNDAIDRKADALHPTKRNRPIARGAIKPATAIVVAACLLILAIGMTLSLLNTTVTAVVILYFVMTLAYSIELKRHVLLDVIIIATGFVLRAWAGSAAVGVTTSDWLIVCMFTLCMFLGFGKRRCELAMLKKTDNAGAHRPTLIRYTPDLLNHLITVSAGIAVVTFLLYTLDPTPSAVPIPKQQLFYTLPIVMYGIFRYAMVTELGVYAGPTEIVVKDKALLASILIWALLALAIVYHPVLFNTIAPVELVGQGNRP